MNNKIKYGLLESDIANILSILKNNHRINKIILFGSRAKGTYNYGSDIDLAIEGIDLTSTDIINISIELDTLFLPYKFDIIIIDRVKEQALLDHINRVGIVLHES